MSDLPDELLKRIAEGSGHTYWHEGKSMAAELIRRRTKEREHAAKAATAAAGAAGWGFPTSIPKP